MESLMDKAFKKVMKVFTGLTIFSAVGLAVSLTLESNDPWTILSTFGILLTIGVIVSAWAIHKLRQKELEAAIASA
jgi:membrane protein YdbS with pleckstrin-like domain